MSQLKRIQQALKEQNVPGILLLSPEARFFATGFASSAGVTLITRSSGYLLTDFRYVEAAEKSTSDYEVCMVTAEKGYAVWLQQILEKNKIRQLGFEEKSVTVAEFSFYQRRLPVELRPMQQLVDTLRAVKQREELNAICESQAITEKAFDHILGEIRIGMTEREVAARLTYALLHDGAEEMAFQPIVVSGPNSSLPHGVPGDRALQEGDFLTMDFGARRKGYCADMTRTVALGHATSEMSKIYDLVLQAQMAGIAAARAGIPGKIIDQAGRAVIEAAGYGSFFGHGFGHGLGIEVHENPGASATEETILPAGQIISAEPGVYLPGRFGVRIEDILLLTETGCENLTHAPKQLLIL